MWRPLARRALLNTRTAAQKLLPPHHLQVPHHEAAMLLAPSVESESRFSIFSTKSHVYQHPRFFSSNQTENYEDPLSELSISEANEAAGGFDFSAMDAVDGNIRAEFESGDSIFDGATENLEANNGFPGESFDGSDALDENLDSEATEVASLGRGRENDPTVENLLSLLQSSWTDPSSLEYNLRETHLPLNENIVLKVLETPCIPGENSIRFFRWLLMKPMFTLTTPVLDALVSAICMDNRKKEVYALWDLVKEVGEKEKGVVSTKSLNELIAEFSRLRKGKAAFEVFNKFEEFGCQLNGDTYYLTIEALCKKCFYKWASSVCENMLNADKLPDAEKVGKIIASLCRGGMPKEAHLVYLYAKDKKVYLPQSSINFLIRSLSQIEKTVKGVEKEINKELDKETVFLALEMLNDYSAEGRKYAIKPFTWVIKKLCWIEDAERAKKLLLQMIDSGPPPGNDVFNCVISVLTKGEDMEEAVNMMKLMEKRGLKPDVYTYSVLMSGYARIGEMEKACKIFDEAKTQHSKLSPVTFHILIRGYCKLEQYDKAVNLLGQMKEHGVNPNHDEYNKLIKSVCLKAVDWETAEKLQEEMRGNGLILNSRTRALISAIKELEEGANTELSASNLPS